MDKVFDATNIRDIMANIRDFCIKNYFSVSFEGPFSVSFEGPSTEKAYAKKFGIICNVDRIYKKSSVWDIRIYNAYEENSATVHVSDSEILNFNTHDELISILKKIFCWEAGDPEDVPDPREIHNWVRRFCGNHYIRGVHLRQMVTSDIVNSWDISYDVSALNLENSITALRIAKNPNLAYNEVFIEFNNETHDKFTDMNGLFFILKRKLKPETTVQNSKPQIWSSLCQLTSLLEEVQASQYKLATSANERNGESCDAAILGR
jgi:hypothetical protein